MEKSLKTQVNAITEGVIWKQILLFFFPILFGTFFQQLYNTVDAIIVGQYLGKAALAAVGGGTGTAINLLIGFFIGVSSGSAVVISQFYGAKENGKTTDSINTSILLSIYAGLGITILGLIFTKPLLKLIGTPDDIMPLAVTYMRIIFAGSIFNTVFNMGSGVMRALGDSKRPLYFLIAGVVVNIVLDYVFVGIIGMNVEGAAYATIISQFVSAILTIRCMMKNRECPLTFKSFRMNGKLTRKMMAIGLPTGFQSILYTISNLIIQAHINGFGTDTAAAWAAFGKLDAFYWTGINAFGIAATTFVGQNFGAGKLKRVRKGIRDSILMSVIMTVLIQVFFLTFGETALNMFTSDTAVITIGMKILTLIAPYWITYLPIEILSGSLRGCGKTIIPTAIVVFGICVIRVVWLAIVPAISHTLDAVFLCYPVSWILSSIAMIIYTISQRKNLTEPAL